MRKFFLLVFLSIGLLHFSQEKLRPLADTIGFAHTPRQMDSVMARILRLQSDNLKRSRAASGIKNNTVFKTVIAPHDDYTYSGYMYPLALENVKAKTVILFGVAHKARAFKIEDKMVFESYTHWRGPYGKVKVSDLRGQLISGLPDDSFLINDSLQKAEHSLEAKIPFLQYFNRKVEIIPVLVPTMSYAKISELSEYFVKALMKVMEKNKLKWGKDIALVVSADAVHYGDEGWSGRNFAFYGADSVGYKKAVEHEYQIMNDCMKGEPEPEKVRKFTEYTVQQEDFREYKWTWCGRYSVPFGLSCTMMLEVGLKDKVDGKILDYSTSLSNKHIPVNDLGGIGITAPANIHHWVGYPAIGFW